LRRLRDDSVRRTSRFGFGLVGVAFRPALEQPPLHSPSGTRANRELSVTIDAIGAVCALQISPRNRRGHHWHDRRQRLGCTGVDVPAPGTPRASTFGDHGHQFLVLRESGVRRRADSEDREKAGAPPPEGLP
jgi:hypothetical protein